MPTINKRGDSYQIVVSCGYDSRGKHLRRSMTWTPSQGMTERQIAKELSCFGDLEEAAKSDKNPRVLLEKISKDPAARFPRIYSACGTEDILYDTNCLYRDVLESYGIDLTWESLPGRHDWDFWDLTIERVLNWLPL